MTEQEKVQRDRVIEAVFPVIADRMGWHHRIDEHPPRNTNFACDVADAAIAAMQPTPQEPRCAKCGHPKSNHPYRHPFVSIAQDAAMDRLVAEGQRCDATTPQEASLDERMKAAGMIPLSQLLKSNGAMEKWERHAGMQSFTDFVEWVHRKQREYMTMRMRYELGDKDKGDDLFEWVFAHAAVFNSVATQLRAISEDSQ